LDRLGRALKRLLKAGFSFGFSGHKSQSLRLCTRCPLLVASGSVTRIGEEVTTAEDNENDAG